MSWYFLGGFSAYRTEPSGRRWNHSGCSCHPGVVGRALEGVVERHLEAEVARLGDEAPEVVERAELGGDGGVAAVGRADGPRAAGIVGAGVERVVRALAGGDADRVDRRQVDDVEPHLGDGRQSLGRARPGRPRCGGTARTRRRSRPAGGRPTGARVSVVRSASGTPATRSATRSSSPALSRTCSAARRAPQPGDRVVHPPARPGAEAARRATRGCGRPPPARARRRRRRRP